jgi:acetyltransferase
LLRETPPSLPVEFAPRSDEARRVIEAALAAGRDRLSEAESKAILAAYGVPVVATRIAHDAEEAARLASEIGFPVALKILSPDVVHKSDVGGVALDLETRAAVLEAAHAQAERLRSCLPAARLDGFTVQPMARRPAALELFVGITCDAIFGPVVLFGHGGVAVEQIGDRAIALPPLNLNLARELVGRTRVARLLGGFRNVPPVDRDALDLALVKVSQIAVDLPEVVELDVNPLLADAQGVLALDARIRIARPTHPDRLAIRPYPRELEETISLRDGRTVQLRPIRPEDEPAHLAFFGRLSPEDVRFRFFNLVREIPHSQMARYTQIDYDREMAFIATVPGPDENAETLGVVSAVATSDGAQVEFAIQVRTDLKGQGLGHALLEKMIRYCRARGVHTLVGQVLPDNHAMLELANALGFKSRFSSADGTVEVRLALDRRASGPV